MLRNGDVLRVGRLKPQIDSGVVLEGFVHRPGPVAWSPGLRVSDVLGSVDELKPDADQRYILIRRESGANRKVEALSADLVAALAAPGHERHDTALMPRDRVIVFDLAPGRDRIIKPMLDELRLQSGIDRPTELVRIEGKVKVPGEYPLEPGMTVSDLLRAGGNLEADAFGGKAELARYEINSDGTRETGADRNRPCRGPARRPGRRRSAASIRLRAGQGNAQLDRPGVRDPAGRSAGFPVLTRSSAARHCTSCCCVLAGLRKMHSSKGSAFTRTELKEREQKQLDFLQQRLQADLASMALQAAAANQAGASQALTSGQSLLGQLQATTAVGRLVIDLPALLASEPGSDKDVVLRNGDTLVVPLQKQEVTVIGEVQSATSHLYNAALDRGGLCGPERWRDAEGR